MSYFVYIHHLILAFVLKMKVALKYNFIHYINLLHVTVYTYGSLKMVEMRLRS